MIACSASRKSKRKSAAKFFGRTTRPSRTSFFLFLPGLEKEVGGCSQRPCEDYTRAKRNCRNEKFMNVTTTSTTRTTCEANANDSSQLEQRELEHK